MGIFVSEILPRALDRVVKLYIATNKAAEAEKWRTERANYPAVAPPREKQ
jgi:serine/threonine-protein kinase